MSSLPPFLSSPLSSSSPAFLLFLFVIVAVLLIQINRRTGSSPAAPGPPPARGSIPCLPWLPVAGSLPWLGGGRPGSQAKEVLLQKGRDFAGRPTMVTTDLLTRGGKDIAFSDYSLLWKRHRRLVHNSFTLFGEGSDLLFLCPVLSSVDALCVELLSGRKRGFDPSPAVTRAVTNVVCMLVFNTTYRHGDAELQEVIRYNDGIVETITRGGLVDIYPWMKDRVQKELDDCVGSERPVCLSDRSRLPYLDCVINEGMRIRPVSPILIPHIAMTHSSIGGHSVSQGTRVLVNMWSIHHDTEHWDKPDIFNPDRFLNDQGQRVIPPCFLPFGAGPRVCVGESLARLELFMFLSSLLQRLSFRLPDGAPPPNLQGRLGVVLQPLPYEVVVTPRAGWKNSV
uniref:Cytochrome P450, family 17, subfamily A, polypeptide 2 n=1 Tax=Echeneis naucrates TaxID=173247 RepID=A0A665U2Y6_ECHNA